MYKLELSNNYDYIKKILELKLKKKLKSFKFENYLVLSKDSIIVGIKCYAEVTKEERRFISVGNYQLTTINDKEIIFNFWVDDNVTREERFDLITAF